MSKRGWAGTRKYESMKALPIAAGILEIALVLFITYYVGMGRIFHLMREPLPETRNALVVFGFVTFTAGILGGISAIKRARFSLALAGACLAAFCSVYFTLGAVSWGWRTYRPMEDVLLGLPLVILSILCLALILASRREFARRTNNVLNVICVF